MANQSKMQTKLNLFPREPLAFNKGFWDEVGFVRAIDMVASRYGVLPTDLLSTTLFEFNVNIAIAMLIIERDKQYAEELRKVQDVQAPKGKSWSNMGIEHEVVKHGK